MLYLIELKLFFLSTNNLTILIYISALMSLASIYARFKLKFATYSGRNVFSYYIFNQLLSFIFLLGQGAYRSRRAYHSKDIVCR